MPTFRPRPTPMTVGRQLGRPAHDQVAVTAVAQGVKAASDASVAGGYNTVLTADIETLTQRLDDAGIP